MRIIFRLLFFVGGLCVCTGVQAVCVPTLPIQVDDPKKGPWASDIYFKTSSTGRGFTGSKKTVSHADVPMLMATRNGKLYAYFQWFPGVFADDRKYKRYFDMIGLRISPNKGKTWTMTRAVRICGLPAKLVNKRNGGRPMDPSAVQLANGKIRLYFTIEPGFDEEAIAKAYSAISTNGRSFRYEGESFAIKNVDIRDCTVAKLRKTWHMYCPNWKNNGRGYHATSSNGVRFKRTSDAVVGGKRNLLGNVVEVGGKLYFYSGGWVAVSTNGSRFRLLHKRGLPGDPGIANIGGKWFGIEAH